MVLPHVHICMDDSSGRSKNGSDNCTISRKDGSAEHWFCSLAPLISLHQSALMANHHWSLCATKQNQRLWHNVVHFCYKTTYMQYSQLCSIRMHQPEWDNHFHIDFSTRKHQWKESFLFNLPPMVIFSLQNIDVTFPFPPWPMIPINFLVNSQFWNFLMKPRPELCEWNIWGIRWLDCLRINSWRGSGKQKMRWKLKKGNWPSASSVHLLLHSIVHLLHSCHLLDDHRK